MNEFNPDLAIAKLIDLGRSTGAVAEADRLIAEGKATAMTYYQRGRANWKLGRKGEAMSDYSKSVSLDPKSPAAEALIICREVMDFYDKNLYNP